MPENTSSRPGAFGRHSARALSTTAAASAVALLLGGVSLADTITTNTGPDVTRAPGQSVTFTIGLLAENGDGLQGCNANAMGGKARVTFTSSDSAIADAPVSVQVTGCDDPKTSAIENGEQVTVTVKQAAARGAATVITASASETGISMGTGKNQTHGSFGSASFTLNVERAAAGPVNTAPTVRVAGVEDGASYEIGAVPTASCDVTDAEDADPSATALVGDVVGDLATFGLGEQTVNCAYTDAGGLDDGDSVTYSIVDTGAPTIEDLGPVALPDGDDGWYVSAVTNEFKASDNGAGFEVDGLSYEFGLSSEAVEGGEVVIASGTVTDVAGNVGASVDSAPFKIDLSDPTVGFGALGVVDAGAYSFGAVPAQPSCAGDDDVSGLASCEVTGYSTEVGDHTATATATDVAGRTATAELSYSVLAWETSGFTSPVSMDKKKVNKVKGGSAVPLKFTVSTLEGELTETSAITSTYFMKKSCDAGDEVQSVPTESSGATTLRYADGHFIYNWKAPTGTAGCFLVGLGLKDGQHVQAEFQVTK